MTTHGSQSFKKQRPLLPSAIPTRTHLEVSETNGAHFIAMEFIDGDSLTTIMSLDKNSLGAPLAFLSQVAEGLAKAHGTGIVHRNLEPDNIREFRAQG